MHSVSLAQMVSGSATSLCGALLPLTLACLLVCVLYSNASFHAQCAAEAGYEMTHVTDGQTPDGIKFVAYCNKHRTTPPKYPLPTFTRAYLQQPVGASSLPISSPSLLFCCLWVCINHHWHVLVCEQLRSRPKAVRARTSLPALQPPLRRCRLRHRSKSKCGCAKCVAKRKSQWKTASAAASRVGCWCIRRVTVWVVRLYLISSFFLSFFLFLSFLTARVMTRRRCER